MKTIAVCTSAIGNIFKEGELQEAMVCREFRHTTQHGAIEGKTQEKSVKSYNLDVVISVGYRVKSVQGTQFRIWATGDTTFGHYFTTQWQRIIDARWQNKPRNGSSKIVK